MLKNIENKIKELNNKFIWKIKSNKKKIVLYSKGIIIFWMFVSFTFALFASYIQLVKIFFTGFTIFLTLSIFYYSFLSIKEDRIKLMNMWKMYFPVITLMFIFIYSIEDSVLKMKIDYYKTKLSYEIKTNSSDVTLTFENYKNLIDNRLDFYKKEDINTTKITNPKQRKEEHYTIWYANLGMTIMNILTSFMFLWSLTELSLFNKKEAKYSDKYKKVS